MIQEIYSFCKVRDNHNNLSVLSNRGLFIQDLLERYKIEYELIPYDIGKKKIFYNFYIWGPSNKFVTAHYDVVNPISDNANDNSASVINALVYKLKNPSVNVIILDGEEPPWMGDGSKLASKELLKLDVEVDIILNLELTGFGEYWFIDNSNTPIVRNIIELFSDKQEVISIETPFNDAQIFRENGFNSCVITTLPLTTDIDPAAIDYFGSEENVPIEHKLKYKILYYSHTLKDSVDNINTNEMDNFINNVIDPIIKNY